MDSFSIRQGDTFDLPITLTDEGLATARLIVKESIESVTAVLDIPATFANGTANFHKDQITTPVGDYIAQIDVYYVDGSKISFPDPETCNGDSDFIQVKVKPSLSSLGVS